MQAHPLTPTPAPLLDPTPPPSSYLVEKLRQLAPYYWGNAGTADIWLLIHGAHAAAPTTVFPAHAIYLHTCVPTLRACLAPHQQRHPDPACSSTPAHPATPLVIRPPCPDAFPALLHWIYTGDVRHLLRYLREWKGAVRGVLANAAWAGVTDRELRLLCDGFLAEEEGDDEDEDEDEENGTDEMEHQHELEKEDGHSDGRQQHHDHHQRKKPRLTRFATGDADADEGDHEDEMDGIGDTDDEMEGMFGGEEEEDYNEG